MRSLWHQGEAALTQTRWRPVGRYYKQAVTLRVDQPAAKTGINTSLAPRFAGSSDILLQKMIGSHTTPSGDRSAP